MRQATSRQHTIPTVVAAIAAAALLASGCAAAEDSGPRQTQGDGFISGDSSITLVPVTERKPAPPITATMLTGEHWALADQRGTIVVLNVWASWCAPCRAEAPTLKTVSEMFKDRRVAFVGINTRDSRIPATAFEKRFAITYPSLEDQDGRLQVAFADTLPPTAIPATVVIDRDGLVAGRIIGRASESTLRGLIEALLYEDGSTSATAKDD